MSSEFHVGLSYQEGIPQEFIDEFVSSVRIDGLELKTESRPLGYYASLEWAIPSIVIAYLTKPYFEAFLQEAGKDHYLMLKRGFMQLFKRLYGTQPEQRKARRSPLFSVMAQRHDGHAIKFVFPEGVTLEDYELAVDLMHRLLKEHYDMHPNDQFSRLDASLQAPSHITYVEYTANERAWTLIDPLLEGHQARQAQDMHSNRVNKDDTR